MRLRKLRKGLVVLLTATMVVGLMPDMGITKVSAAESTEPQATDEASVTINGETLYYATLEEAFSAASGKTATITMLNDAECSSTSGSPLPVIHYKSNITLNMNGKTLSGRGQGLGIINISQGSLLVQGPGTVKSTTYGLSCDGRAADMTVEDITVDVSDASYGVDIVIGTVTLNNVQITGKAGKYAVYLRNTGNMTINNVSATETGYCDVYYDSSGTLKINGGTFDKISVKSGNSGGITSVSQLLGEGCTYRHTDKTWATADELNALEIQNVTVEKIPLTINPQAETSWYYNSAEHSLQMNAVPTTENNEITYEWYDGDTKLECVSDAYTIPKTMSLGNYNYTCKATCDGYTLSHEFTFTVEECKHEDVEIAFNINGFGNCPECNEVVFQPAVKTKDTYDINNDGTYEEVYEISNAGQLYWFAGLVNGTLSGVDKNISANAVLTTNITVNKGNTANAVANCDGTKADGWIDWTPIGTSETNFYAGTFDGQGHTVSGLYFNNSETSNVGLFGYIHHEELGGGYIPYDGTIKNVGVIDSYFYGLGSVGSVCGKSSGTITNCFNTSTVKGNTSVGGVCGYTKSNQFSTITNCYSTGTVTATGTAPAVGGVCGFNGYEVANCYYLEGTTSDKTATSKTALEFASGEVAYLLSLGCTVGESEDVKTYDGSIWGQTLGDNGDTYPVLKKAGDEGNTVYRNIVYSGCSESNTGNATYVYANKAADPVYAEHTVVLGMSDDNKSVITKCSVCSKQFDKVTLCVPETEKLIYDGNPKEVKVSGSITGMDTPKVVYRTKDNSIIDTPKDAGTYTASLTYTDSTNTYTISEYFEITRADNAFTTALSCADAVWTSDKIAPAPNAVAKDGTVTYKYATEIDGEYTANIPSVVGTYFVKAYVAQTTNYNELISNAVEFSISCAHQNMGEDNICDFCGAHQGVIVNNTYGVSYSYTGNAITSPATANFSVNSGATPTFAWYAGDQTGTTDLSGVTKLNTEPTNAGTYTLVVTAPACKNGDEDYTAAELRVKVEINKADATVSQAPKAATGLTYNKGEAITLIDATDANVTGGEIWYALGAADGTYSKALPTATDAGEYHVYYKVVGDDNHNDTEPVKIEVTVEQATPDYTVPTNLTAKCGDMLSSVTLTDGFEWTDTDVALQASDTESGQTVSKTAKFVPTDKKNYKEITGITINIKVEHTLSATQLPGNAGAEKHASHCSACNKDFNEVACSGGTATCSKKAVCSVCGGEYGALDPDNHKFTNYVADNNDATCTTNGHKTATCDYGCGTIDTKEIADSALGHDYEASYTWAEDGSNCTLTLTCKRQGCTAETDGHEVTYDCTIKSTVKTAATCKEKGTTTYTATYGNYSDTKDIQNIAINPENHDFAAEFTVDKEATCTEAGSKSKHCSRCDEKSEVTEIPKKEHTWDSGKVTKEATCTEQGVLTYTCDVCHETKTADIAINPNNHAGEREVIGAVEATCKETGYTGDTKCKACGVTLTAGTVIDKLTTHSYVNGVCSVCDDIFETTVDGITYKVMTETGTDGKQVGKVVTVFGNEIPQVAVAVTRTGNDFTEKNPDGKVTVPSEITGSGSGQTFVVTKISENAFSGVSVTEIVVPATVTEVGNGAFGNATTITFNGSTVPSGIAGAISGTGVTVNVPEGAADSFKTALGENISIVEAHTHKYATTWTYDDTCHWHAATCGHAEEIADKAEHTFGSWVTVTEATEDAEGVKERSCSCGYKETEEIAKLPHTHKYADTWTYDETGHWKATTCGHDSEEGVLDIQAHTFGEWTVTKEATEDAEGVKERSCSCGYKETAKIDKIAHTTHVKDNGTRVEPTCEKKGSITYKCTKCGEVMEVVELAATGHKWDGGKVTKEATLAAEGVKTYTCSVCGKTRTEAIPKKTATTPQPPKKVTDTPQLPKKGDVVVDDKGTAKVEVADVTKKEVTYKEPVNKKAKTVTIPTTVKINGVTYEVTKIADNAFKGNKTVTKVTIGRNIKSIGKNAFYGATKLSTVSIGKSVTVIGANAFKGCTSLTSVTIPSKITKIGANAFYGCKKLKKVSIGKSVTEIGANAFKGCSSLTSVTIPSKTTKIGANAFYGCKKLKTITIKSTKLTSKTVSKNAFKGLTKATTIKVPKKKLNTYKKLFKSKGLSSKVTVKGY